MLLLAHILLDHLIDGPTIGMPKHHTRGIFLEMEQVKFFTNFTMIALLGFFEKEHIFFELLFIRPGGAINTLELLIFAVATPVSTRDAHQLKVLTEFHVRHVRAATHIHIFFVMVETRTIIARDVLFQYLFLIGFVARIEGVEGLLPTDGLFNHGIIGFSQLQHALLDAVQVVFG